MRGKLDDVKLGAWKHGITPADAGKTGRFETVNFDSQDHPRGCGENNVQPYILLHHAGSPPRMRGKLLHRAC